jgi:hypothetical protein
MQEDESAESQAHRRVEEGRGGKIMETPSKPMDMDAHQGPGCVVAPVDNSSS